MIQLLRNIWNTPDLRAKILFTLAMLLLFRVLAYIPMPGVNVAQIQSLLESNQLLSLLNLFSGGGFANFSIITLGLNPYINASIIMQLMTMVLPQLEELSKEGPSGQRKINQYTRFLTVPLAVIQGIGVFVLLRNQGLISSLDYFHIGLLILTMVAGTLLVVWLGELISEKGIGNGISILIFAGILAQLPSQFGIALQAQTSDPSALYFVLAIALLVIAGVVYITEGMRPIPVQYAKRVAGNKMVGGQSSHIPLRVNQAGVIPIIFAISLVMLPTTVSGYLIGSQWQIVSDVAVWVNNFFANTFNFAAVYFLLVVAFTFFYSTVSFNPQRIGEDLQKHGGFIPGIRPGAQTQSYLKNVLMRITLVGGVFLAAVAVLPYALTSVFPDVGQLALGGTSLLIMVSVVLETSKQIQAMLVMRNYEGFLN